MNVENIVDRLERLVEALARTVDHAVRREIEREIEDLQRLLRQTEPSTRVLDVDT